MLLVNEIFGPTVQGEGKTIGKKVIFLRLAICNLSCIWCDTPYAWNWKQFDQKKEIRLMSQMEILQTILGLGEKALVVSGGEPLLQQRKLISLFAQFKALGYWIEIETNGTQVPSKELTDLVDQFNCSPKLENSGVEEKLRINQEALKQLASLSKTTFKFVVSSRKDLEEITYLVNRFQMKQVYLMPLGKTADELNKHKALVEKICKEKGYHFTTRLHVELFGGQRAV
jgi:7-cyano-7-deazaguanosine (preQ0) biosynthesis protein QueE